jgi:hypothetical protein
MNYRVEIDNHGRAGDVRYIEDEQTLTLFWEYVSYGVLISIPNSEEWNDYCKKNAIWAIDRREEILQRVAEQACLQQAPTAKIEITDEGIELKFR